MSESNRRSTVYLVLAVVIDFILLMAYVSLSLAAYSTELAIITYVRFALIWLVILLVPLILFQLPRIFVQYGQLFYSLQPDEMLKLLKRLIFGPSQYPPQKPVLQVQDGQVISEVPGTLETVGGPGYLGVEHNNAVVTERLGVLSRILGPGFHALDPFEKVWDVVDLRPQRRTVNVRFMTRDGIPAKVDAEVVYRIPFVDEYSRTRGGEVMPSVAGSTNGASDANHPHKHSFSPDAVLTVATEKIVNGPQAPMRFTDWINWIPEVVLEGTVRDVLECYILDAFLYPQYWLFLKEFVNQDGETEYKLQRPEALVNHKQQIEIKVKERAAQNGIFVEYVELGPVMPEEVAISREWLEFWQAKLQSVVYQHSISKHVDPDQDKHRTQIGLLVDFIASAVQRVQGLVDKGLQVPPELPVLSFLDILRSLSEEYPTVRGMLERNAEKLSSIVDVIQRPDPPVEDELSAQSR